jgi:hypothetical protein
MHLKTDVMKRFIFITIILGAILSSCTKEPEAGFFTSKVDVYVGEDIYFTNNSLNAERFEWDFGDGTYSTLVNPVHAYQFGGEFTVALTAIGKDNFYDRAYQNITVKIPPELVITVLEYYDEYPVENASVILYPTYDDWLDETNPVAEVFTDADGVAVFENLREQRYYVDVWEEFHDNYTLAAEDVAFIETDILVADAINYFTAWVDYYGSLKSMKERDRTPRGELKGRSPNDKK